jgi:hypothetical protein
MKKDMMALLSLIDESAHSMETQSDPNLRAMFTNFNQKKDYQLQKVLIDLKSEINIYQLNNEYRTPKFLTKIALDISRVTAVNESFGMAAFFSNLWFGK